MIRPLIAFFFAAAVWAQAPNAALLDPGGGYWKQHAPDVYRVKLATTKGDFVIEGHRDWAPLGADRFYNLVRVGFYDDSRFFRVIARDFAQFGIPGDPALAAIWRNASFPDDPVKRSNLRGYVAFAMTGPNTRTTQIFVLMGDRSRQDKDGFAPFGVVVEGMGAVDRLYAEYGESAGGGMRGGKQGKMFEGGNAYLDAAFPKLDRLLRARSYRGLLKNSGPGQHAVFSVFQLFFRASIFGWDRNGCYS